MVQMDASALGTWAAVVVALAIALKDTGTRWRDRSARHLLVSAEILPIVSQLEEALDEVLQHGSTLAQCEDAQALRRASDRIESVMATLSLDGLRGYANQVDCLPERMLIPLAKAITLMHMLNHNAAVRPDLISDAVSIAAEREVLDEWLEQGQAVRNSVGWVARGATELLASPRWKNPERWG